MKKTALITGASKRIGKSLAEHLAEKGWNVAVHFNSSDQPAIRLVDELSVKFPYQKFGSFKANLNEIEEVVKLIPKVIFEFEKIDLLINNASVFNSAYLKGTSIEMFDAQMNVNFKAPFFLIRDFANQCETGNIINFVVLSIHE